MTIAAERQFSAPKRDKLAKAGAAMPDGSFPIENAADLKNAIRLAGKAKNPAAAKAHIIGRAKALKLTALLPPDWLKDKGPEKGETGDKKGAMESEGPIERHVSELLPAFEAVWSDNADGLVQADVVIMRPGEGANRRFYSKEAISEAAGRDFWGGVPMFTDHGADKSMPRKRSVRDLVARIEPGTTYLGTEGEARAKVTFINPDFAKFAKAAGSAIGLSAVHEFMGQRYRGNDGHNHERVDKMVVPHSVDFVAYPAQGGEIAKFFPAAESESESEDNVEWKDLDEEMLREHRPDLVEALAAESDEPEPVPEPEPEPEPAPEGFVSLSKVRSMIAEESQHRIEQYEAIQAKKAEAKSQVEAHVARSGLPPKTRARLLTAFEGQEEYSVAAVQGAIDEAAAEAKELGYRGPIVRNMGTSAGQGDEKPLTPAEKKKLLPVSTAFESQMEYVPLVGAGKGAAN